MNPRPGRETPGLVSPAAALDHLSLDRTEPPAELAWCIDRFWHVAWDLPPGVTFDQEVIPHPTVNVVFEPDQALAHGVDRSRFVRHLAGRGQALGIKFRPGGFAPFLGRPLSALTDRHLPVADIFGPRAATLADTIAAAADMSTLIPDVAALVAAVEIDPAVRTRSETVSQIVELIGADPTITRVADVAERLATSPRRLQQIFADHVGVPPKWVISRVRVHRAVEAAAREPDRSWADLAAELGYADQAHLTRAFRAAVGTTPGRYRAAQHRPS